jgi:hypothetical protein
VTAPVFPELVTGREDGFESGAWTLQPGSTLRGEASCNLSDRVLQVPLGRDETSRVVRAHELTHIRVSPHVRDHVVWRSDVAPRAIECAEELRINSLLGRMDFDVALLRDGSEKNGGRRLGEAEEWAEAVCFLMAVVGTGAEKDFLSGIRQTRPSWLAGLRAVRKRAQQLLVALDTRALGDTRLNDEGLPRGFADFTVVLAKILTQSMAARAPVSPEELRRFRRSLEPGGRRPATGRFAPLRFDDSAAMAIRPRTHGVRRSRASVSGTVMRYPSRLLSDDQQRAFAQRRNVHGGVVVIDQSGSMDIDDTDMAGLLSHAPNALVIGYSHRPGDGGLNPNAWLLANRGAVAKHWPSGNVGNGVDGPALAWAIARRRGNEPVVWVTDGQVTDSHDHPDEALTLYCAELVRRHRVRLVANLSDVGRALQNSGVPRRSAWAQFGRVGRKMLEFQAN